MRKLIIPLMLILVMLAMDSAYAVTEFVSLIRYGQIISTVSRATNVVTVTLSAAYPNNNLKAGQSIIISGVTDTSFNGKFTIVSVASQTSFTYSQTASDATSSGGTAGGDYSLLTTWESANECDLTAAATKVFAHGGITGAIADGASVTGATSGATGTVAHATGTQILIKSITGTFQSGEQVQVDGSNYVTISNVGDSAIAVAECYNDWASGMNDSFAISGWTTDAANYIKIKAASGNECNGLLTGGFYLSKSLASSYIINPGVSYVYVEDIGIYNTSTEGYGISMYSYCYAKRLVIKAGNYGIYENYKSNYDIFNCIIILSDTTSTGILTMGTGSNERIYNCTVVNGGTGIASNEGTSADIRNTVCFNNTTNWGLWSGSWNANCSNNAGASGNDPPGSNDVTTVTQASFKDYAAGDFHLSSDSVLRGAGADLSAALTNDIDRDTRSGLWDIGADETAEQIYRSVGPANTTALATQSSPTASNAVTITAAGVATFTYDLPLTVGVGDVIQYDDGGTATPDQLAFISGRTSATVYTVRKADGTLPTATAANSNWAIYRAYISLRNAEAGIENTGIGTTAAVPLTFRNFDDWTAGGDATTNDAGKDLVTANQQWNIACYADAADTTSVTIDGWTTGAKNYIKIYTPNTSNEVGITQRHNGTASTGYKIDSNAMNDYPAIYLHEEYIRVDGLVIDGNNGDGGVYRNGLIMSTSTTGDIRIDNCIVFDVNTGFSNSDGCSSTVSNCVLYDVATVGIVGKNTDFGLCKVYNCTFLRQETDADIAHTGIRYCKAVNCAVFHWGGLSGHKDFLDLDASSDYLVSSDTSAVTYGTHGLASKLASSNLTTITAGSENLHAKSGGDLIGAGSDLYTAGTVTWQTDIDSGIRWAPWCIGADQSALSVASAVTTGNWNTAATWASNTVPSATQDIIIASGKTITFDKNDTAVNPTCGTLTIYGTLVIDTTTAANRTMVVNGDIIVKNGGVLTIRSNSSTSYSTSIKFNCATNGQYGLIVESGGTLDIQGTSKYDTDVVITALTQDGSHNAYIHCKDGSKSKIKFADISYIGTGTTERNGIYVYTIDNASGTEYFYIEGCKIHHGGYEGIYLITCANIVIQDNTIYNMNIDGIRLDYGTDGCLVKNNVIYNNTTYGILVSLSISSPVNTIVGNIIRGCGASLYLNPGYNTKVFNNTVDATTTYYGIIASAVTTGAVIKNNIVSNHASSTSYPAIQDSNGTNTIDYNLFYNNSANGTTGTNAITASNPNYVSTDSSSVNFMMVGANSAALGAGVRLDTGVAQNRTNIGARLGYAYNNTNAVEFNSMQLAHDDTTCTAGDTITTYGVDLKTDTVIAVTNTGLAPFYAKLSGNSSATLSANDQYIGQYVYMTSGANKGKYYLIVDSVDGTPDTITVLVDASVNDLTYNSITGFNVEDGFTIVDRVYNELAGNCYILKFSKNGTVASPITWNTSGTVILDAKDIGYLGPTGTTVDDNFVLFVAYLSGQYNIFDGFIIRGGASGGVGYQSGGTTTGAYSTVKNCKICYNNICTSPHITWRGGCYGIPYALDNCEIFNNNNGTMSMRGIVTSCIAYKNVLSGIYGGNCAIVNNIAFGNGTSGTSAAGISLYAEPTTYGSIVGNTVFREGYYGIANNWGDYANITNNTTVANTRNGIYSTGETNIVVRNNLVALNGTAGSIYGIRLPAGTGNSSDFNYFYGNGSTGTSNVTGVTEGANSIPATNIAGTDPVFIQIDTGATDADSTTAMIIDAGQGWTVNQWVGYGVKVGTQWAGITSNTANRLHIAPALSGAPAVGTTFYITDFSVAGIIEPAIDAVTTPLGQGARADGSTEIRTVNMGAIRDFVKNTNAAGTSDDTIYNSLQNAHDGADCTAGDTITTYAVDEVTEGTVTAVTNNGATTTLSITEETISADDKYVGYYLYIYAGTNRGYYYVITDSANASPDTVTIYSSYNTNFNVGDKFKIVDRIYDRKGTPASSSILSLVKNGTAASALVWDTSGTVILDGKSSASYAVYIDSNGYDSDYCKVKGFKVKNFATTGLYSYGKDNYWENNEIYYNVTGMSTYGDFAVNNFLYGNSYGVAIDTDYPSVLKNNIMIKSTAYDMSTSHAHGTVWIDNTMCATVNYCAVQLMNSGSEYTFRGNKMFRTGYGLWFYDDTLSNVKVLNNVFVSHNSHNLPFSGSINNTAYNNIFAYSNYGYYSTGAGNLEDFNYYYGNTTNKNTAIGANSIDAASMPFYANDSGTNDTAGLTTYIYDSGKAWTPNQWQGYGVRISSGTGSGQWVAVYSNTADRLYTTPVFTTALGVDSAYQITDFSVSLADPTVSAGIPLGQGCRANGTTESGTVNIGAKLGYVLNNDGASADRRFNTLQLANNDANCSAGDTVTAYAIDEITGSIATATDNGFYLTLTMGSESEATITEDNQYEGMYVVMSSGTNSGKSYMITDSQDLAIANGDATDTDTINILTDSTTGFSASDTFSIVDRVYNDKSTNGNVDLTVSGTSTSPVTWTSSGTVVLDAESLKGYNVYAATGLTGVKWDDSIKLLNSSLLSLGGEPYVSDLGGYYRWGHESVTAVASGNWSSTTPNAPWPGGVVPGAGKVVTIPTGVTVTLDQDVTVGDNSTTAAITVAAGGTLAFNTSASRVVTVKGDINVYGTLTMRAGSAYTTTIKFDCSTNAQFGLNVYSGGFLDVEGASKDNQNCVITALTQDGSHNGYIYCRDGSKTKLKFADISYMGKNLLGKYGVQVDDINNLSAAEYFYMEGCKVHDCYRGLAPVGGSNLVVNDNTFYNFSDSSIYAYACDDSIFSKNVFYGSYSCFTISTNSDRNIISNNIIRSSSGDSDLMLTGTNSDNKVYNNTFSHATVTGTGINIGASVSSAVIINNIVTNNATGITNSGTGTVIDYNLFYGNTNNGTTTAGGGTVAITASNPNFVSTDPANVNYMFTQTVSGSAPALGAGCRLNTGAAETHTNIGARLDYVYNTTDAKKFNFLQQAHDDASLEQPVTAANTITAYAVDLVSDTIQGGVTTTGAIYVTFNITDTTIIASDQYIGQYLYMTTGANRGNYYLIVDSDENTTDTITICPNLFTGTITTGFNTYDGFKIVDRIYDRDGGVSQNANLYLTKDGTAASPITWNTSGTVIVDAKHLRDRGIYGNVINYNTIQGFICEHGNTNGIYLSGGSKNTLISNNSYSNTSYGIYLTSSSTNNIISSNHSYSNGNYGIYLSSSSNNTLNANSLYSNGVYPIYLQGSSSNILISNHCYSNSYGILLGTASNNNFLGFNYSYSNTAFGIRLGGASNNILHNNTVVRNTVEGILCQTDSLNSILRNNISAYNTTYGINADAGSGPTTVNTYNDLYGNTTASSTGITEGTGTVAVAPNFYAYPSGTSTFAYSSGGASGATQITLSTSGWTANQYAGYVLWAVNGSTNYFRRIEYNTATSSGTSTVGIYSTFPAAMSGSYTFKVIDWTVQATELLGGGCNINTGDASSAVNIGSKLGYIKNTTDSTEFGLLQAANDAATCTAGDTVTVYAVDQTKRIE